MTQTDKNPKNPSKIPVEIQEEVLRIVENYNKENETRYIATFRGKFCYISRIDERQIAQQMTAYLKLMGLPESLLQHLPLHTERELETHIGRLTWTGNMNSWDFAVYRYSKEAYDPNEWHFAVGTSTSVLGVLKAGYEIYPK